LADQQLFEDAIVRCMLAEGFDYKARSYLDQRVEPLFQRLDADYANEFGLGIVSGLLSPDPVAGATDPNTELYGSLSVGERRAWDLALRGSPLVPEASGRFSDPVTGEAVDPIYGASDGCTSQARTEVLDSQVSLFQLADDRNALIADYEADPRIIVARQAWEACMASSGFNVRSLADLHREIDDEIGSLRVAVTDALLDLPIGLEPTGANMRNALPAEVVAQLESIQAREIVAAQAAVSCQEELDNVMLDVLAEYDQAFRERNRSALQAYEAARSSHD